MKKKVLFHVAMMVLLLVACDHDESFTKSPSCLLTFSVDTLRVDTVFSGETSATYSMWVHNYTSEGIRCSDIRLERGVESGFRVNVDGVPLQAQNDYCATDIEIRSGDSIRIFVDLQAKEQHASQPQVVTDNLLFSLESGVTQKQPLRAHVWDAIKLSHLVVETNTTLASSAPILIRGGITVEAQATLTLAAGTTLYFHEDAGITVAGRLVAEGTPSLPVVLRGDRLDDMLPNLPYDRVSGQWQGIRLLASSKGNILRYTDLHGAYDGVTTESSQSDEETLCMEASTIHNCKGYGLKLQDVRARLMNCVFSNTWHNCVYVSGGDVSMNHCTIAQFYPFDAGRGAALYFKTPLQQLVCRNSLVTGYGDDMLVGELAQSGNTTGEEAFLFEDCILRTPEVTTVAKDKFVRVLFENATDTTQAGKKHFLTIDTNLFRYDFSLSQSSKAIDAAHAATSLPTDRNGRERDDKPDVGAYEYVKP